MSTFDHLVEQVYDPPHCASGWSIESFLGAGEVRYFSYGRYALRESLLVSGVRQGEKVLLPAFVCRDLLAAIHSLGAIPSFYSVEGKSLNMADIPDDLPAAHAIVAVNYFGFPQNLEPFRRYCHRTNAVLIEDNAHGLLSRDESGKPLGTRGDLGIFSLRKTIPLPNGAALFLNPVQNDMKLGPQQPFSNQPLPWSYRMKQLMRILSPVIGWRGVRLVNFLGRRLRKARTGYEIAPSPVDAEFTMPENASPCKELMNALASFDDEKEAYRRRALYLALDETIKGAGGVPVFPGLPDHVVPYGFPFYSPRNQIEAIKQALREVGLDCYIWPELPREIVPNAPVHYRSIWMVNFVW